MLCECHLACQSSPNINGIDGRLAVDPSDVSHHLMAKLVDRENVELSSCLHLVQHRLDAGKAG
jgi:hypothetical protein